MTNSRRERMEELASTDMGRLKELEAEVLGGARFVRVTNLRAAYCDSEIVIRARGRLGIHYCDARNNVLVAETLSRDVWIRRSPSDVVQQMPPDVIIALGLLEDRASLAQGMFEEIDREQFGVRIGNPDWEPSQQAAQPAVA